MIRTRTLFAFLLASTPLAALGDPPPPSSGTVAPWVEPGELPLPEWAKSVAPRGTDIVLFQHPTAKEGRRAVTEPGIRLPLLGAVRGPECSGRWLLVGPSAWVCDGGTEFSADPPSDPAPYVAKDGLIYAYFAVGKDGVTAYAKPGNTLEEPSVEEFEPGRVVAITMQLDTGGASWGKTTAGLWLPLANLRRAHPSLFHGDAVDGPLSSAWVVADKAMVFATAATSGKPKRSLSRLEHVTVFEESAGTKGASLRVSADGVEPAEWVHATDVARPVIAAPPDEIGGAATKERWIDVSVGSQILVAYEGVTPVYTTLVSTGRGAVGSETATPLGVHRVWVKLMTSSMKSQEHDENDERFSLDDVPWVQFIERGVALHGAYWHQQWGRAVSHGCVNLAPIDAEWIFRFTAPHLPANWRAVYPTPYDLGTAVRVRP